MNQLPKKILIKKLIGKLRIKRNGTARSINLNEYRVFSQHREDGIIEYLLDSINDDIGQFVEFGFAPDESNCLNLAVNRGFSGLFMDGAENNCANAVAAYHQLGLRGIQIRNVFIARDNLESQILDSGIHGEIDVLSIDVDGNDYWLWESLVCINPRIVVIEYNASFGPDRAVSVPYDDDFVRYNMHESGIYHGCSLSAIEHLGKLKGYRLLAVDETGVNAFLVRQDLCLNEPTMSSKDCFKDNRGRVKYKKLSREDQFAMIKDMPLVDVTL